MRNVSFDTCVYHQPGIDLLTSVISPDNILFASEMLGAVRGDNPDGGLPLGRHEAVRRRGEARRRRPRQDLRAERPPRLPPAGRQAQGPGPVGHYAVPAQPLNGGRWPSPSFMPPAAILTASVGEGQRQLQREVDRHLRPHRCSQVTGDGGGSNGVRRRSGTDPGRCAEPGEGGQPLGERSQPTAARCSSGRPGRGGDPPHHLTAAAGHLGAYTCCSPARQQHPVGQERLVGSTEPARRDRRGHLLQAVAR